MDEGEALTQMSKQEVDGTTRMEYTTAYHQQTATVTEMQVKNVERIK